MAEPKKPNEPGSAPVPKARGKEQASAKPSNDPAGQTPTTLSDTPEKTAFQEGGGQTLQQLEEKIKQEKIARQESIGNITEEVEESQESGGEESYEGSEDAQEAEPDQMSYREELLRKRRQEQRILSGEQGLEESGPDAVRRMDYREIEAQKRIEALETAQTQAAEAIEKEKKSWTKKDSLYAIINGAFVLFICAIKDILDIVSEVYNLFQDLGFFASAMTVAFLFPIMTIRRFRKKENIAGKMIFSYGFTIIVLAELIPFLNLLPILTVALFYLLRAEVQINEKMGQLQSGAAGQPPTPTK